MFLQLLPHKCQTLGWISVRPSWVNKGKQKVVILFFVVWHFMIAVMLSQTVPQTEQQPTIGFLLKSPPCLTLTSKHFLSTKQTLAEENCTAKHHFAGLLAN